VNALGTVRLLELCREKDTKAFVLGSSSSVYGDDTPVPFKEDYPAVRPISPYAASKRSAELFCSTFAHLYGIRMALLRFFTVFGPRQRPDLAIHKFAKLIQAGSPIELFGDGSTSRDYTFVTDIVSGVLSAEKWALNAPSHSCELFNLGGSHPIALSQLVKILENALDRKAKVNSLGKQPGDVERTYADVSKSKTLLGYEPKVGFEEGVKQFVNWMRSAEYSQ
jgi:UDP-glucuronate 4-epimerase